MQTQFSPVQTLELDVNAKTSGVGPVLLDAALQALVSGGSPKGGWEVETSLGTDPSPKGGW